MIADEGRKKGCGPGLTGIGRDEMATVRVFVEALSHAVDTSSFRFRRSRRVDLHSHGSAEHIANNGTGVTVRGRRFSRCVANFNDLNLEVLTPELWQRLGNYGAHIGCRLMLCDGSRRSRRVGRKRCVADSGDNVGPAFDQTHGALHFRCFFRKQMFCYEVRQE